MASDKPAVVNVHTPSSSLALVHSGIVLSLKSVVYKSHLLLSHSRHPHIALRQAQQKEKYRILWETRWAWVA